MFREKTNLLFLRIKEIDQILSELKIIFKDVAKNHSSNGGHIEYVYLGHFLNEIEDISYLFKFLYGNKRTQRFLSVANRMLFEIFLKSEYLIKLKNIGGDKEILSLLSKDMASSMSALDEAVGSKTRNPATETLNNLDMINKLLGTDFNLKKIRSNTSTFPKIKKLCEESNICLKNYCGDKLYHYYVQWSWNNHSRLGHDFSLEKNPDYLINNEVECFIEIYLKNIKLLSQHSDTSSCTEKTLQIMKEIKVKIL
jgi:hypothetical protein